MGNLGLRALPGTIFSPEGFARGGEPINRPGLRVVRVADSLQQTGCKQSAAPTELTELTEHSPSAYLPPNNCNDCDLP